MSLRNFLTSRVFLKNLVIALVIVVVTLLIVMQWLRIYTLHGQANVVPDFKGMMGDEIAATAVQNNLNYEIIDSVFDDIALPGTVVEQQPEAGFKVKKNRTIFLTINSTLREQVSLPKLTDISFRQAQVLAENNGLTIGKISYEPSEFNDLVLRVEQYSLTLNPGDLILKNSSIDLVLGSSHGNVDTHLPDLTGVNVSDAKVVLTNAMLNMGVIIYDVTCANAEDSLNAFVWKQYPSTKNTNKINLGSSVDLWLTVDSMKITPPLEPLEIE